MKKNKLIVLLITLVMITTGCFGNNDVITDVFGESKSIFQLGETVVYNEVYYTVIDLEYQTVEETEDMYNVIITMEIENNSYNTISYNILDWLTIDLDNNKNYSVFSAVDSATTLGSGDLMPGETIKGTILFVHNIDDEDLKLVYLNNSIINNDYVFEINLNK